MSLVRTTSRRLSVPPSERVGGFTLVETLVALSVSILLLTGMAAMLHVTTTLDQTATTGLDSSTDAFRTSSRFADDVAAAGPLSGVTAAIARNQTGCGNAPSVLRISGPGNGTKVVVRSYTRVTKAASTTLVRRVCQGASLDAAIHTAPTSTETVVHNLGVDVSSTSASCPTDDPPTYDDSLCTSVSLKIVTKPGFTFTVAGSIKSTLAPTATTAVAPPRAPATGTCTIAASETGWGATGGLAGGTGGHTGDATLYTYNDTNQRNSFIRFDLTTPCIGASDSWPTLPGGRTLTSVKLLLTYLGKTNDKCLIFPGISYDGQVLETLDTAATWTEATLTGSNMPGATRSPNYSFNVSGAGNPTTHISSVITDAVRQWYTAGGWKNNGFRLRRSSVGDTCGDSNKFASRFDSNASHRPTLVITWG